MDQKRAVTGKLVAKYRRCRTRGQRSGVLQNVEELTGYNRHYAAWLLRNFGRTRLLRDAEGKLLRLVVGRRNPRRPAVRPRKYDEAVKKVLVFLWDCFDQMCGKRLVAILPDVLPVLVTRKRLSKGGPVYGKLTQISAATIDRLLKSERAKRRLKGIAHTKPSSILKNSIPIVVSSELPVDEPGYYQIDLVGHDGGNPNGHFAFTLNAVELFSGWVEPRILLNKAQRWSQQAVKSIHNASPLPLKGLHSDNDSAFLNEPLQRWCATQNIPYMRGRPHHSNDTCYVEQKNYNIVRQALGYPRYETQQEVQLIGELYENLRLLINFFYPSVKLLEKKRVRGRIRKRYDRPKTPAQRLLDCAALPAQIHGSLRQQLGTLDPFVLKGNITRIQTQLLALVRSKNMKIQYPGPTYPQARERMSRQRFG
jgi:transposase